MGNAAVNRFVVAAFAAGLLVCALGCKNSRSSALTQYPIYTDFRGIPGVTDDEIEAVEALRQRSAPFVYGMNLGAETFYNEDGDIRGYSALFCAWLSTLFGIPFEPAIYEWDDLIAGLKAKTIDFSGELSATDERRETYFMTDVIAERSIKYMRLIDGAPLSNIAGERPIYDSVSLATQNPDLEPVISVVQKALENNGHRHLINLYNQGQQEYLKHKLFMQLDPEELAYIHKHGSGGIPVPFIAEHDNYPVSFYNYQEKEWQGIAFDVLKEVEKLTGLSFRRINDGTTSRSKLLEMLESGEASLVTELIRSDKREGHFLWADESFQTDYFALLSKLDFPNIRINEIDYTRVGLVRDAAYTDAFHAWFPDHPDTVEYVDNYAALDALARGDVDLVMATENLILSLTNYREMAGYKVNVMFDHSFESSFGFSPHETLLCSIVEKALRLIDTSIITGHWNRRAYDYHHQKIQTQRPWLFGGAGLLFCVLILLFVLFQRNRRVGHWLEQVVHDRTLELVRQDKLLHVVNDLAAILLASDADKLKGILNSGLKMIAECVLVDRVYVWRNIMKDGELYYSKVYDWVREGEDLLDKPEYFSYQDTFPHWQESLALGQSMNGPLVNFTEKDRIHLDGYGIKSILVVPVFLKPSGDSPSCADPGVFWGFASFDDCHKVRSFTEKEESILRSGSLMIVNAILRNELAKDIKDTVAKMEAVISNYSGVIWSVNREGIITLFNGLYLKKLGLSPASLEGKRLETVRRKSRYLDIIENMEKAFNSGPQEWVSDINGSMFHSYTTPIQDGGGNVVAIVGSTDDITETMKLQRQLESALDAANEASRAKSYFLANMSHEIRTPMNAIIGMTSVAKNASAVERKDYCLSKIEDASNHLLGVINDILDMSKIEANKFELSPVEFGFEKMLRRVVNVINFRVDEKHQRFSLHVDRGIPRWLVADDQRLAQVITNLLSNAVKFTPEYGNISLDASFVKEEDGICTIQIEVTDTGIGISAEQQERLFNSFQQAESSTSRKFGGTGLGLALSKRIVEMMNGRVWIESKLGEGSSFGFTMQAGRGEKEKHSLLAPGHNWKNIRVLVVDDDADIRSYFSEITQSLNVSSDAAGSGEEAAALIREKGPYDIYFVDWNMPGMNGIDLTRRIKEKNPEHSVVIMISATEWSVIEGDAKQAGVDKFLSKPLFSSSIADVINECLGLEGQNAEEEDRPKEIENFENYHIMLAEDVEINREIVLTLLEPTGIAVDCAENGAEALRLFRETPEKYDLIFMDVQMPKMDGYEATRHIRAFEETHREQDQQLSESPKRIPIIAMTANVFREDIEKCLEAGMDSHVGKPLDFGEVLTTLRRYLPESSGGDPSLVHSSAEGSGSL
jgi:PAS domain S-box-containing protein